MRKLAAFDFDNTLIHLPYVEDDDYMQTEDSLKGIDLKMKKEIVEKLFEEKEKGSTIAILTNRGDNLRENILSFLSDKGIEFDIYLFMKDDRNKGNRLIPHVDDFDIIEFWDDKQRHLDDVKELGDKYNIEIRTNLVPI